MAVDGMTTRVVMVGEAMVVAEVGTADITGVTTTEVVMTIEAHMVDTETGEQDTSSRLTAAINNNLNTEDISKRRRIMAGIQGGNTVAKTKVTNSKHTGDINNRNTDTVSSSKDMLHSSKDTRHSSKPTQEDTHNKDMVNDTERSGGVIAQKHMQMKAIAPLAVTLKQR